MEKRTWSQEEIALLTSYVQEGKTPQEIASLLERTRVAVYHKIDILGLDSRFVWNNEEIEQLKNLVGQGLTQREIANEIGRPEGGVMVKCKQLNLQTPWSQVLSAQRELKIEGKKKCPRCDDTLIYSTDNFRQSKGYCRKCEREYNKEHTSQSIRNMLINRLRAAKGRSTGKGISFAITLDDLLSLWDKQNSKCFYTGTQMSFDENDDCSVSIDRIRSDEGYTKDNIVLCCAVINYMKRELSIGDFKSWCKRVADY